MRGLAGWMTLVTVAVFTAGCVTTGAPESPQLDGQSWRSAKARMYHDLALKCLRAGDHPRARRLLEQALQFDVPDMRSLELLARLTYSEGDLAAASNVARIMIERDANSVEAWCTMGAVAEAEGRPHEAEKSYKRACASAPDDPRPATDLHRFYLNQGDEARAQEVRDQLVASHPDRIEAWLDQGAYLAATGRWADAAAAYRHALAARPASAEAAARFAFSALACDRPADVVDLGESLAPRSRLQNSDLALALAVAHLRSKEYEAALHDLDLLPDNYAGHASLRVLRGELLQRLGRADAARAEFEAAVAKDPSLARAHASLGRIHLREGRLHAGVRALRTALQYDPRNGVSHALTAAGLAAQQDLHGARRHLARARQLPGAQRVVAEVEKLFPQLSDVEDTEESPR